MRIVKHYSPLLHRNYFVVFLGRWSKVFTFTPTIFINPFDDLVKEYLS